MNRLSFRVSFEADNRLLAADFDDPRIQRFSILLTQFKLFEKVLFQFFIIR